MCTCALLTSSRRALGSAPYVTPRTAREFVLSARTGPAPSPQTPGRRSAGGNPDRARRGEPHHGAVDHGVRSGGAPRAGGARCLQGFIPLGAPEAGALDGPAGTRKTAHFDAVTHFQAG